MRVKHTDEMPARDLTPEHTKRRPADGEPNHPDVQAAMRYVESVADTSDFEGTLAWHGWALREAFLAGVSHAAAAQSREPRTAPEPASGGCGECAIVRNCRETGYCPCLRVPFVAAADARRAIERRQP
jgi:hypothetical protein